MKGQNTDSTSTENQIESLLYDLTGFHIPSVVECVPQAHFANGVLIAPPPPPTTSPAWESYIGSLLHIVAHLIFPTDLHLMREEEQGWAWPVEDQRVLREYAVIFPQHASYIRAWLLSQTLDYYCVFDTWNSEHRHDSFDLNTIVRFAQRHAQDNPLPALPHTDFAAPTLEGGSDGGQTDASPGYEGEGEGESDTNTEDSDAEQSSADDRHDEAASEGHSSAQSDDGEEGGNDNSAKESSEERGEEEEDGEPEEREEEAEAGEDKGGDSTSKKSNTVYNYTPREREEPKYTKQHLEDFKTRNQAHEVAEAVFPDTPTRTISRRNPTAQERKISARVASMLRKSKTKAPQVTRTSSKIPPGRLSGRTAQTLSAQKALRLPQSAEPFVQLKRRVEPNPPPLVGLLIDTSGSMKQSQKPMSLTSWILASATRKVGGKFAAVSVGDQINAFLRPGQTPRSIPLFEVKGAERNLNKAALALTGALKLDTPVVGARMLIISTDAVWVKKEIVRFNKVASYLERKGCKIIWLDYGTLQRENVSFGSIVNAQDTLRLPQNIGKIIAQHMRS